jgi:hypothetical protein
MFDPFRKIAGGIAQSFAPSQPVANGAEVDLYVDTLGYQHVMVDNAVPSSLALHAAHAETASGNSAAVVCGAYKRLMILLNVTSKASVVGDTLDVYVDVSPDGGTTYVNAVHFTQLLGNGAASAEWAVLDPAGAAGTATVNVTTDAAAAAVRPALCGDHIRCRWVIAGSGTHTFNFVCTAFAQ